MLASSTGVVAQHIQVPWDPGPFDAGKALGHVERLSYPRRVGTPGERRAARDILLAFSECGLLRRLERFRVPFACREINARLAFAACAAAVLLGVRILEMRPLVAAASWVMAGALVNAPWWTGPGSGVRWPSRLRSRNLVATLPDPAASGAPARVVFMAHYDTKSQPLPTGVRVGLVVLATACCAMLAAIGLVSSAGLRNTARGPGIAALCGTMSVCLAVLAANVTGNRSPGALDNATGVATLLELARTWRPRPGAPVEVVWIATGAEEVGLVGAREFLRRQETWLRTKPTLLINLDTVGVGDRVYLAGEPRALRFVAETADELGMPCSRLRVLGAFMDHEPFAARGLWAVSLLGDVVGRSLTLHSARDIPALADRGAIARAGRLAAHAAWAWAERNKNGGECHDPASAVPKGRTPASRGSGSRRSRRAQDHAERV